MKDPLKHEHVKALGRERSRRLRERRNNEKQINPLEENEIDSTPDENIDTTKGSKEPSPQVIGTIFIKSEYDMEESPHSTLNEEKNYAMYLEQEENTKIQENSSRASSSTSSNDISFPSLLAMLETTEEET